MEAGTFSNQGGAPPWCARSVHDRMGLDIVSELLTLLDWTYRIGFDLVAYDVFRVWFNGLGWYRGPVLGFYLIFTF